ncbi:hypothetical protein CsSME_00052230 [Camellia sinensis var. sinensis]
MLKSELQQIKRLMKSQEIYEKQGRPFALSSETSHNRQRYAAKGDDVEKLRMFATPRMDAYLEQAKSFDEDPSKTLPSGELTFSEVKKRFGVVDGDGEAAGLRWHHSPATEAAAEDRNWEVWQTCYVLSFLIVRRAAKARLPPAGEAKLLGC